MKNMNLLCALTLLTAVAASGCEYARYETIAAQPDATKPFVTGDAGETTAPATDAVITPEVEEEDGNTQPTTETDIENEDSLCPAGTVPQGTTSLCCRINDPQDCMIVDPGPGEGGVKPTVDGISPVDAEIVDDNDPPPPDDPTPPPPPPGDVIDDEEPVNCFDGDSSDDARRKRQEGVTPGTVEEALDRQDCVMARERVSAAVRDRVTEAVR